LGERSCTFRSFCTTKGVDEAFFGPPVLVRETDSPQWAARRLLPRVHEGAFGHIVRLRTAVCSEEQISDAGRI
jgi:hypothetical protein